MPEGYVYLAIIAQLPGRAEKRKRLGLSLGRLALKLKPSSTPQPAITQKDHVTAEAYV